MKKASITHDSSLQYCQRVESLMKKSLSIKIRNYAKNTPDYPKSWLQDIYNNMGVICATNKLAAHYITTKIDMYRRLTVAKHIAALEYLYEEGKTVLLQKANV